MRRSYRCLSFAPNDVRRFDLYFWNNHRYVIHDESRYLTNLAKVGFQTLEKESERFFKTIGRDLENYIRNTEMGYRHNIYTATSGANKGKTLVGKTSLFHRQYGEFFRGTHQQAVSFLKTRQLSPEVREEILQQTIAKLRESPRCFNPEGAELATKIKIPASDRGLAPDYRKVTETVYENADIFFRNSKKNADWKITMTGDHATDVRLADLAAGITAAERKGYVWHHLDDFNPETGQCTMQLVLAEFHKLAVHGQELQHIGGSGLYRNFYFKSGL